jgi:outer membrane assembly lipoprotein YfiO
MTPACRLAPLVPVARIAACAALALGLGLGIGLSGCASGGGHPLAQASGPDQLRVAHLRYDRHEYTETIDLVKGYLQYQSGAGDLDDAHFLLGMCYVQQKDWPLAATEFVELTSNFADSPRVPDGNYWLAYSYWKQAHGAPYDQDMTQRAIAQCDRFLTLYPTHPKVAEVEAIKKEGRSRLAEKAVRNGRLYLKLSQFSPARYYFEKVQKDFADTPWVEQAKVGEAEALFGQGKKEEARVLLGTDRSTWNDSDARRRATALLKRIGVVAPLPASAEGAPG